MRMTVPVSGELQIAPPPLPPSVRQQQMQPIVVMTGPQPQSRLESGGWFARAFSTTAGIFVAIIAFMATGFGLMFFCCFGLPAFFMALNAPAMRAVEQVQQEHGAVPLDADAETLVAAKQVAAKYGLNKIEATTIAREADSTIFTGLGTDSGGMWHDVMFVWLTAGRGAKAWELLTVSIDKDVKYRAQ